MLRWLWLCGGVALLLASSLVDSSVAQQLSAPSSSSSPGPTRSREISSLELQQYATTVKRLQIIGQKAQQQMNEEIANEDLTPERFREIELERQNRGTQPSEPITDSEKESFVRAQAKLKTIHQETEIKMQRAVETEGLEVRRFQQISTLVQQNPALQQQVQQMLLN